MTRSEFAKLTSDFWREYSDLDSAETLEDYAARKIEMKPDGSLDAFVLFRLASLRIATNGFDPEPNIAVIYPSDSPLMELLEQSQEAAKRSRPFVGSHKLPFDSDWD